MVGHKILPLAAAIALLSSTYGFSSTFKVIANPSVRADSITPAQLRGIFMEESRSLGDGSHVEPVVARSGEAHEEFLRQYLGKDSDELQNYYRALVFTGKGSMPKTLDSDAEIADYVAKTKGAIGYVSAEEPTEGVKVLTIVDTSKLSQRKLLTRIEPQYPATLKQMKIGGSVRLQVTISAKGSVETVQVLGGNPILGEAAQAAVKQWVYAPSHAPSTAEVVILFDPSR